MKLSRDPDTLRIPAFMRKRSLSARHKQPLVLTALDRKKAGLAPAKKKKLATRKPLAKQAPVRNETTFAEPLFGASDELFVPPSAPTARMARPKRMPKAPTVRPTTIKHIGTLTHYYDKIRVGVIALSSTLEVGDAITYETAEGLYTQIVESMEIDRQPVFKAGKGKEIGMKLKKAPRVGAKVVKA